MIHIVSFDIPYPPDYGGVIDVYYKLRALKEAGVDVILHCFEYQRPPAKELNTLCKEVHYYPRKTGWRAQCTLVPYIVSSRTSRKLLNRLLKDEAPILFEGMHSCGWLNHPLLQNRLKIYRESNIEHDYYRHLAKATKPGLERFFYQVEAYRLKWFQKKLAHADVMLTVSRQDQMYLQKVFPDKRVDYLPSFHKEDVVNIVPGSGDFILYQGNLSVAENEQAALYIADKIWQDGMPSLVIAGKNPSLLLKKSCQSRTNVTLVENPSEERMEQLIRDAHINLMITFQPTGLKLKLLHALFQGRFCLVNPPMLAGTSLKPLCLVEESVAGFRSAIKRLFHETFPGEEIDHRKEVLGEYFNNKKNCKTLMDIVTLHQ